MENKKYYFYDTETCGFSGVPVTIQYAVDDGPIIIHHIWMCPISDTLKLINDMMDNIVVGFNLTFDQFQLCKIYTIFELMLKKYGNIKPREYIDEAAELESEARDGNCLKPYSAVDVMCVARKTKYQSTMDRKPIKIKRVPRTLAWKLAKHLEEKIELDDINFANAKDKKTRWQVKETSNPELKDVVLKFRPSTSLKNLAVDALNEDSIILFQEINVPSTFMPVELPFAPVATLFSKRDNNWNCKVSLVRKGKKQKVEGQSWPGVLDYHIRHWFYNEKAKEYAAKDVDLTRRLYYHFDRPKHGDDDSILACCVAAVRWKGYKIDVEKLKRQREICLKKFASVPQAPSKVKIYLGQVLSPTELAVFDSTKKVVLERLRDQSLNKCVACDGKGCIICDNNGQIKSQASIRAKEVLDARAAKKEVELYDKLIMAGRFHAAFKIIGTLSSRMSGDWGLNAQGIKSTDEVRSGFIFAFGDYKCPAGDFSGFEVVLADAVFGDPKLRQTLLTCEKCQGEMTTSYPNNKTGPPHCTICGSRDGMAIHGVFGQNVYPGMSYKDIKATKGKADDKYTNSKRAVFGLLYGGNDYTLATKLGVSTEVASQALESFERQFPTLKRERQKIFNRFCSMRQPAGIGTKVEWHEPAEYAESLFGFRRYFHLENKICKALFNIANHPPQEWKNITIKVKRKIDREQTASGAVQSALFGAAFGVQASNMRAGMNHVIQSSGAQITKRVERRIWDIQPHGYTTWLVQPCNVHDEIITPTHKDYVDKVKEVVDETVELFRPKVPLISMEWKDHINNWSEK